MGMDDVAHLGGSKSVGILKRAKVPFTVILGILRIVVFERIPTALDGRTGCPLRYTARDKISRCLIPRQLVAYSMTKLPPIRSWIGTVFSRISVIAD